LYCCGIKEIIKQVQKIGEDFTFQHLVILHALCSQVSIEGNMRRGPELKSYENQEDDYTEQ